MEWEFLKNLLVLITGAVVLGLFFERIKLNAMLGYLLAGTLLGPGAFGVVSERESIEMIAELGVALLLFSIGLEFSIRRLLDLGKVALVGGTLQVVITICVIAGICYLTGLPVVVSIAIGAVLAPSSTACVLRLLRDRGELDSIRGRNALGILLLQDAALVPLVLLVSSLSGPTTISNILINMGTALGVAVMFVIGIWVLSKSLLPALLGTSTKVKSRELFVLLAVAIFIGAAWTAHLMHLSPALGAFAAGVLLAESPFATQIRADLSGVRILFVTLFFTSVGMLADLNWLSQNWYWAGLVTILMMTLNAAITMGVLMFVKVPAGPAFASGVILSQAGEFSFVLATMAAGGESPLFDQNTFQMLVTATLVSLFLTPFLIAGAPAMQRKFESVFTKKKFEDGAASAGSDQHDLRNHVIVIGYGPAGRRVVEALRMNGELVIVVELNPKTVEEARKDRLYAEMGDATQSEVLEHVSIHDAIAVVVTIPDHNAVTQIIRQVRQFSPEVPVFARARLARYIGAMKQAGADLALDEEDQIGIALGEEIVRRLSMRLSGVVPKMEMTIPPPSD